MPNLRPIEMVLIVVVILVIAAVVYFIVKAAAASIGSPGAGQSQPTNPIETRLAELDDLRSRNLITEEEYRAARSAALTT